MPSWYTNKGFHMTQSYNSYWQRNLLVCFIGSFSTVFAMTLMLPFLPLYVEELGVHGHSAVVQWSGVAFSATFITAGLIAPVWGKLGDRYGRKSMLVRASLGMAITVSLMGLVTNIWQLVGLRLLVGLAGGYSSGATILIAVQAPRERAAWALGIVSSGVMAGNLVGPLAGGWLPGLIGIRSTFFCAGALILLAFIMTLTLIREEVQPNTDAAAKTRVSWSQLHHRSVIICMLCTGLLLMLANMSIEPIITVYIRTLVSDSSQITKVAGYVMAAAALGSIIRKGGRQDRTRTHYHYSAGWGGFAADPSGICHLRLAANCIALSYGACSGGITTLYCCCDTPSRTRRNGWQHPGVFSSSPVRGPVHGTVNWRGGWRPYRNARCISGNQYHSVAGRVLELQTLSQVSYTLKNSIRIHL